MKLMQYIANRGGGVSGKPASKRARLESMIPTQAAAKPPKKNMQPAAPPPPKPVPPPLWLSGQLPASQLGRGAVSKGVRSGADEGARALEEDTLCTEGLAHQQRWVAPEAALGAATKAAGVAGNNPAVKAKIVKTKSLTKESRECVIIKL